MNAKGTRKVLNVAFKQFQRLPDLPPIKLSSPRWVANEGGDRKVQELIPSRGCEEREIRIC